MSEPVLLFDATGAGAGAVPAEVKWTQKLMSTDKLDRVLLPWEYLRPDGTTDCRADQVEAGWYAVWRGHRYIVEDPDFENGAGIEFTARSAETELANFYTNYSPGPATYLNMLPSAIYAAMLSGKVGRPVKNPGFGILDASTLPTNWSHPTGWTSQLVSSRRVWRADAGSEESYSDDLPCTPGVSYRVKVDIAAAGATGTRGVKLRWIAADGTTTDSAVTNLATEDGAFHATETADIVALGTKLRIVLVTSGTTATTDFDDVRLYEIGPDTGWTAVATAMDARDASVPYNDGALQKYGVWTEAGTPVDRIESTAVGDYVGRVFNGPFVTVNFAASGAGAQAKVRVNGVVKTSTLDVSSATTYTVSGLDPTNDHIVEVEVAAVKVSFLGLTVSTDNLISMRWDWKGIYEAIASLREAVGGELSFNTTTKTITHALTVGQDLKANNVIEFRGGVMGQQGNITKMRRTQGRGKLVNRLTFLGYGEGQYQLTVTVDATGTDPTTGLTSIATYGVQRGTYTDKECKSLAAAIKTAQRLVEQSCWYRDAYTVEVTDAAAALCVPGDTGHFVYGDDINVSLRILEISRQTGSGTATLKVANITEDVTARIEASRRELATLSKSYQGVPTDANDTFSEQFERTSGGTDVPAEVGFFIPYGADLLDLRLRYQVGGMRSFAKAVAGGGVLTSNSGGGSTSGCGGGETPTSSSVSTPSGGGSTTPSGGGSTSGSTVSDIKTLPSVTRNPSTSSVWYEIKIDPTNRDAEYVYFSVANFSGGSRTFYCRVYTGSGQSGTLVGSSTISSLANGSYGAAVIDASSYTSSTLYACVEMYTAGGGAFLFCATRYGYSSHTHSTPAHTHSTPNHTHPSHSHTVTVSSHTHTTPDHTHTIPGHTHSLSYGIYESSSPATIRVYLDGVLVTSLNDATVISDFDLLPYIARDSNGRPMEGWHTLEYKSATAGATGSVRGTLFARKFLGTEAA